MLGASSHLDVPAIRSLSRELLGADRHRGSQMRTDIVEPGLQLGGGESSIAGQDRRDEVLGFDDALVAVMCARQGGQFVLDALDECVDVLVQCPGHYRSA